MFFSKSHKWKKVGDAVLAEVQPLVVLAERHTGQKLSAVKDDNYFLGFITGLSALTAKRIGGNLNQADSGMILFFVINSVYGEGTIDQDRLVNLLTGIPHPDQAFIKGYQCAAKTQASLYDRHVLQNDPDYLQALDAVRSGAGQSMKHINPGSTEDSNVAVLLMHQYFFQPLVEKLGRP